MLLRLQHLLYIVLLNLTPVHSTLRRSSCSSKSSKLTHLSRGSCLAVLSPFNYKAARAATLPAPIANHSHCNSRFIEIVIEVHTPHEGIKTVSDRKRWRIERALIHAVAFFLRWWNSPIWFIGSRRHSVAGRSSVRWRVWCAIVKRKDEEASGGWQAEEKGALYQGGKLILSLENSFEKIYCCHTQVVMKHILGFKNLFCKRVDTY